MNQGFKIIVPKIDFSENYEKNMTCLSQSRSFAYASVSISVPQLINPILSAELLVVSQCQFMAILDLIIKMSK